MQLRIHWACYYIYQIVCGSLKNTQTSCFSVVTSCELPDKGHKTAVRAELAKALRVTLALLCSASPQCVPPDEACTSLDASTIWAMMQNKKTFTKPLAVIHHEVESKGVFWEAQSENRGLGATC